MTENLNALGAEDRVELEAWLDKVDLETGCTNREISAVSLNVLSFDGFCSVLTPIRIAEVRKPFIVKNHTRNFVRGFDDLDRAFELFERLTGFGQKVTAHLNSAI